MLGGPIVDVHDNVTWWKLHGPQGEGWCNEEFLQPID